MKLLIEKALELSGWKSLKIDNIDDFNHIKKCFCCNFPLQPFLTFLNRDETRKIHKGFCNNCGLITFMDKPSHEWIINFYNSTWNKEENEKNIFINTNLKDSKIIKILEQLKISKGEKILEIGTGRGGNFVALHNYGYTQLYGVENSEHRGNSLSKKLDVPIYIGGFEEERVQKSLRENGPFRFIFTSHVLEHVYNPEEAIELCSKLQSEGDFLHISVPNFLGEPTMGVLMFLPHLHSFTIEAITSLLNRKGYEVIFNNSFQTEVNIIAKKTENVSLALNKEDFKTIIKGKIDEELRLSSYQLNKSYIYYFSRKNSKETCIKPLNFLNKIIAKYKSKKQRVRSISLRKIKDETDTLEITFPDQITLFYK
jgi:2-polyprenyl-3-methyl-5-hydroxy-6-metoxy-1,4-benzoquinol methylase